MFGFILILIGVIAILQYYGVIGPLSGLVWGIIFIALGVFISIRSSARRQRRADWIEKRRARKQGSTTTDPTDEK